MDNVVHQESRLGSGGPCHWGRGLPVGLPEFGQACNFLGCLSLSVHTSLGRL
jgi:hypothetical protein